MGIWVVGTSNWKKNLKNKVVLAKLCSLLTILFILTLASNMAVLHGHDAFPILVLSTKIRYSSFFEKGFCFPENLFQSQSIKNVQNFH